MTDGLGELLAETTRRLGHLEGELQQVQEQLASSMATEDQLRRELGECRLELVRCEAELEHAQSRLRDHEASTGRVIAELEGRLAEAQRVQHEAERDRAVVISALGQRARRRLTNLDKASDSTDSDRD